jgi:serine acetyltransferase
MGVNASLANNINIGNHCLIGAAALVLGHVPDRKVVTGVWKEVKPPTAAPTPTASNAATSDDAV